MRNRLLSRDAFVRYRLGSWPQRPPGLPEELADGQWMRARPGPAASGQQPYLKLPGSGRLRTFPDALWLHFGGTPAEAFVDVFAIEACGSMNNLLDKRSRFAPSTQSLMAVCPLPWLLGPRDAAEDPTPRWRASGVLREQPNQALIVPVRDSRVMYGLEEDDYRRFRLNQLPHAHELYVPMDELVAGDAVDNPAMRALVARATAAANFLAMPVRLRSGAEALRP